MGSSVVAQSGFRVVRAGSSLWIYGVPYGDVDVSVRSFHSPKGLVLRAFEVEINGITRDFGEIRNITIWSWGGAGRTTVSIDDIWLEGTLDIQLGDSHDNVAVGDSVIEGDVLLEMGAGQDDISLGGTLILGRLSCLPGDGFDTFNSATGSWTTSQSGCVVMGDFLYRDAYGRDVVVVDQFHVGQNLLVSLVDGGILPDSVRIIGDSHIDGNCEIQHDSGTLFATIQDTNLNGALSVRTSGDGSQVTVGSGSSQHRSRINGGLTIRCGSGGDSIRVSGIQSRFGRLTVDTNQNKDGVHVQNCHFEAMDVHLGSDNDWLVVQDCSAGLTPIFNGGLGFDSFSETTLKMPDFKPVDFED